MHDNNNKNNTTYLPVLDFGRVSNTEGSQKSPPVHSDDEVTPRRGLDNMMSDRKLEMLGLNVKKDN